MKLTTSSWGNEISWTFGSCSSAQEYASQQEYTERCCLTSGEHTLTCKDSYGDGWHGGFMEIGGTKYCDDFQSGSEAVKQVTLAGKYVFIMFLVAHKVIIMTSHDLNFNLFHFQHLHNWIVDHWNELDVTQA